MDGRNFLCVQLVTFIKDKCSYVLVFFTVCIFIYVRYGLILVCFHI
jgi:hypothetical protein